MLLLCLLLIVVCWFNYCEELRLCIFYGLLLQLLDFCLFVLGVLLSFDGNKGLFARFHFLVIVLLSLLIAIVSFLDFLPHFFHLRQHLPFFPNEQLYLLQDAFLLGLVHRLQLLYLLPMLFLKGYPHLIVVFPLIPNRLSDRTLLPSNFKHSHSQFVDIHLVPMKVFSLFFELELKFVALETSIIGLFLWMVRIFHGLNLVIEAARQIKVTPLVLNLRSTLFDLPLHSLTNLRLPGIHI